MLGEISPTPLSEGKTEKVLTNLSVLWSCCTGHWTVKRVFCPHAYKGKLSIYHSSLCCGFAAIMWPHWKNILSKHAF